MSQGCQHRCTRSALRGRTSAVHHLQHHPATETQSDLAPRRAAAERPQFDEPRRRFQLRRFAHRSSLGGRRPPAQPRPPAAECPRIEPLLPAECLHRAPAADLACQQLAPVLHASPPNHLMHRSLQSVDTGAPFSASTRETEERLLFTVNGPPNFAKR